MYCKECGAEVSQTARFCPRCGAPVVASNPNVPNRASGLPVPPQGCVPSIDPAAPNTVPVVPNANSIAPETAQPKAPVKRGRKPGVTFALVFLFLALAIVLEVVGYLLCMFLGDDAASLGATLGACVGAAIGMVALGGKGLLRINAPILVTTLKKGWWLLFVNAGLMAFDIIAYVSEEAFIPADNWPIRMIWTFALCMAIGFSEEGMFRGLLLGGFLDINGKTRRGLFVAVILTSLLFGAAHVDWGTLDYADPLQLVQSALKIVQTGMLGYICAALVVNIKSIMGPALLHGLMDFLLMAISIGLIGEGTEINYVSTGEEAVPTIILYLVVIVLYVPVVVIGTKMLRKEEVPNQGMLHK